MVLVVGQRVSIVVVDTLWRSMLDPKRREHVDSASDNRSDLHGVGDAGPTWHGRGRTVTTGRS
jgi:hypothetical protein